MTGHAASLAHRQLLMPEEECGLISSVCQRSSLGQLTQVINEHKVVYQRMNNLFMLLNKEKVQHELNEKLQILVFLYTFTES